jgi:hypothetical protein
MGEINMQPHTTVDRLRLNWEMLTTEQPFRAYKKLNTSQLASISDSKCLSEV